MIQKLRDHQQYQRPINVKQTEHLLSELWEKITQTADLVTLYFFFYRTHLKISIHPPSDAPCCKLSIQVKKNVTPKNRG